MRETPQQYVKRILGYIEGRHPLKAQASAPGRLVRLIRGTSQKRLSRRPAPGKWSVKEILAHLSDTELVGGYRIRKILEKNGTPIQAFDQDEWAKAGDYKRRDPRRSLELFSALRKANLELLRSLGPAEWKRYGLHQERGKETIAHIVRLFAGHDINHIRQIERILGRKAS
jgi:hypothetical protein